MNKPINEIRTEIDSAEKTSFSKEVKAIAFSVSASACSIADASLFGGAPSGFQPGDILKGTRAVVVIGLRTPRSVILEAAPTVYTRAVFYLDRVLDDAAYRIALFLEDKLYRAVPIPGRGLNMAAISGEIRGDLSLKHAASLAGLGEIACNSLLLSPEFGNALALSAVVTDAPLAHDSPFTAKICDNCGRCAEACPVKAIQGFAMVNKERCRNHYRMYEHLYKESAGLYFCRECRRSAWSKGLYTTDGRFLLLPCHQ